MNYFKNNNNRTKTNEIVRTEQCYTLNRNDTSLNQLGIAVCSKVRKILEKKQSYISDPINYLAYIVWT